MILLHAVLLSTVLMFGYSYLVYPFNSNQETLPTCRAVAVSSSTLFAIDSSLKKILGISTQNISDVTSTDLQYPLEFLDVDTLTNTLYTTDSKNHIVMKIATSNFQVFTVAGIFSEHGSDGDGLDATSGLLNTPKGISFDSERNDVYVADSQNYKVRKVDSSGILTTVAGTGDSGATIDGASATATNLGAPYDVAVDTQEGALTIVLYIADYQNGVLMIDSKGIIKIISPVSDGGSGPTSIVVDKFRNCIYHQNSIIWKFSHSQQPPIPVAGGGEETSIPESGVEGTSAALSSVTGIQSESIIILHNTVQTPRL